VWAGAGQVLVTVAAVGWWGGKGGSSGAGGSTGMLNFSANGSNYHWLQSRTVFKEIHVPPCFHFNVLYRSRYHAVIFVGFRFASRSWAGSGHGK
jgi:hypothetical protein